MQQSEKASSPPCRPAAMARPAASLAFLIVAALAGQSQATEPPQKEEKLSVPVPHGHTSHVHPYNANRDREWYVEARWGKGDQYKAQDGEITVSPSHAPVPAPPPPPVAGPAEALPGNTGYKAKKVSKALEGNRKQKDLRKMKEDTEAGKAVKSGDAEQLDGVAADGKNKTGNHTDGHGNPDGNHTGVEESSYKGPKQNLDHYPNKPEVTYAVPVPHGHTSHVNPANPNNDREWYVEARWKPEDYYKPQDGAITALPKHAPRVSAALLYMDSLKKHHHHHHHKKAVTAAAAAALATTSVVKGVKEMPPAKEPESEQEITNKMQALESDLAKKEAAVKGVLARGHLEVNGPLPTDFKTRFSQAVSQATGCAPNEVLVIETNPIVALMEFTSHMKSELVQIVFEAPADVVKAVEDQAADPESKLSSGNMREFLVAKEDAEPEANPVQEKGIDVDTSMPYGELEPFGREDTAQELTESSIKESDEMVDQLERAEVAEEKRSVFRALTRLRGAAITSFDGVARAQTGNIDEYNKVHKWRKTHPLHHLADEESDISKWAFPDNADF